MRIGVCVCPSTYRQHSSHLLRARVLELQVAQGRLGVLLEYPGPVRDSPSGAVALGEYLLEVARFIETRQLSPTNLTQQIAVRAGLRFLRL